MDYYVFYNEKIKDRNNRPMMIVTNKKEYYIFKMALEKYDFKSTIYNPDKNFLCPETVILGRRTGRNIPNLSEQTYSYNIIAEYKKRFETIESLYQVKYEATLALIPPPPSFPPKRVIKEGGNKE